MRYAQSINLSNTYYADETVDDIPVHCIPVESMALRNFIVPVQSYNLLAAPVAIRLTKNDLTMIQDNPSLDTASEVIYAVSNRSMDPVSGCAVDVHRSTGFSLWKIDLA